MIELRTFIYLLVKVVPVSVESTDTDTDTKPEAEILTDTDTDTSIGCSLVNCRLHSTMFTKYALHALYVVFQSRFSSGRSFSDRVSRNSGVLDTAPPVIAPTT